MPFKQNKRKNGTAVESSLHVGSIDGSTCSREVRGGRTSRSITSSHWKRAG